MYAYGRFVSNGNGENETYTFQVLSAHTLIAIPQPVPHTHAPEKTMTKC